MSRFADPTATDVLPLPVVTGVDGKGQPILGVGCSCPPGKDGTAPHAQDVWVYRTELGDSIEKRAGAFGWAQTGGAYYDWVAAQDKLLELASVSWNLTDEQGEPVPINTHTIARLDEHTREAMARVVDEAQSKYRAASLPNPSAEPSSPSTLGSTSRTPRRKKAS